MPLGLLVVGTAAAALVISRTTASLGRGRSLMLGYVFGGLGALLVVLATTTGGLSLLLLGSTLLGAANASLFLTRYAAAELGSDAMLGRALGVVLVATAIGAVASPNLLGPSTDLASAIHLPALSGLYLVAAVAFPSAAVVLGLASTRSTEHLGRAPALLGRHPAHVVPTRSDVVSALRPLPTRAALFGLGTSNLVMVAVMAIAPVHLIGHSETVGVIGLVISIHVAGMFAPSPISGWMADRIGPATVAGFGSAMLIAAGVVGAVIPTDSTAALTFVLVLLGIGWNFGVVGASTLLVASVPRPVRPRVEGIGEVAMGLAAAVGAPLAGVVAARGGMVMLWLAGAAVATTGLIVARFSTTRTARPRAW